jgi:hypothetical protein
MTTIRKLVWLNGWLVFAFLFLGSCSLYFSYFHLLADSTFAAPDQRLSLLVAEITDLTKLRVLFQGHLETEQQLAQSRSSILENIVWFSVLISVCAAAVALANFFVLRKVRGISHDEP